MHLSELFTPKKNNFLIGHEDKFYLLKDLLVIKSVSSNASRRETADKKVKLYFS